jgi:hypothetical protein
MWFNHAFVMSIVGCQCGRVRFLLLYTVDMCSASRTRNKMGQCSVANNSSKSCCCSTWGAQRLQNLYQIAKPDASDSKALAPAIFLAAISDDRAERTAHRRERIRRRARPDVQEPWHLVEGCRAHDEARFPVLSVSGMSDGESIFTPWASLSLALRPQYASGRQDAKPR